MQIKLIFSLVLEQIIVLLILLIHLRGFIYISEISSINKNILNNATHQFIEHSSHFKEGRLSKKVVLVVIDALRVDQLVADDLNRMKYCKELMEKKKAIGYKMKTASPTVTMPRLKSIVSGSISSYMDVIFNFATGELLEKNIVEASLARGLKTAFYGDETWLKLFPKAFHHWEGVTSFFVSDYTEVDKNVTRHIPRLLSEGDWDFLILHYLGLDHIGHLEGPSSSLIQPKLNEMDNVIKDIHQSLSNKDSPYLIIVCGDHGMSDDGSHGGSSHAEIWTSALVISNITDSSHEKGFPSSSFQRIRNQVDLASTLALHLGVPVPEKNVGYPLFELLDGLPMDQQMSAHYRVSKQLMSHARQTWQDDLLVKEIGLYNETLKMHREVWLQDGTTSRIEKKRVLDHYKEFELLISSAMTDKKESYNFPVLFISSVTLLMISLPTIIWSLFLSAELDSPVYNSPMYDWRVVLLTVCGYFILECLRSVGTDLIESSSFFLAVFFMYGISRIFSFVKCFTKKFYIKLSMGSSIEVIMVLGVFLLPFSLLATSFVEEEHFGFYFFVSLIYILLLCRVIYGFIQVRIYSINPKCSSSKRPEVLDLPSETTIRYPIYLPALYDADIQICALITLRNQKRKDILLLTHNTGLFYSLRFTVILLCWVLFRSLRAFNSTGDKWKHVMHINDYVRNNHQLISVFILLGLLLAVCLFKTYGNIFLFLFVIGIYGRHINIFDGSQYSGTIETICVYLALFSFLICNSIYIFFYNWKYSEPGKSYLKLSELVIYFLQLSEMFLAFLFLLLQKPENVLVTCLGFFHIHLILPVLIKNYSNLSLTRTHVYVFAMWLSQAHFFIQGASNSLSSVQIHTGFVGITSYRPIIHGILIAVHTFGMKFLVLLHALIVFLCFDKNLKKLVECLRCWWMMQLLTLTVYVFNVTLQRYHLFIWSVFTPKLLFEECHFICLLILNLLVFGCIYLAKLASLV